MFIKVGHRLAAKKMDHQCDLEAVAVLESFRKRPRRNEFP